MSSSSTGPLLARGLDLDAPVEVYRPKFAEVQVLEGFDGDTLRLRAPASRAAVRVERQAA